MTKAEKEAKEALDVAIQFYANAYHEAGYHNGTRLAGDVPERKAREMAWWRTATSCKSEMERAIRAYARAVRAGAKP